MIAFVFGLIVDRVIAHADRTRRADEIAHWCASAYSFDAFGPTEWRRAARMMAARGYSDLEIEAVLRSKWTRWSQDAANAYTGTAKDLARFLDQQTPYALRQLVRETFPEDPRR